MQFFKDFESRRQDQNESTMLMMTERAQGPFRGRGSALHQLELAIAHEEGLSVENHRRRSSHQVNYIAAFSGIGKTRLLSELPEALRHSPTLFHREFIFVTYNNNSNLRKDEIDTIPNSSTRFAVRLLWAYFSRGQAWGDFYPQFQSLNVTIPTVLQLISENCATSDSSRNSSLSLVLLIDEFQRESQESLSDILKELMEIAQTPAIEQGVSCAGFRVSWA